MARMTRTTRTARSQSCTYQAVAGMAANATTSDLLTILAGERAALAYCALGRLRRLFDESALRTLDEATRERLAALEELHRRIVREPPASGSPITTAAHAAALFADMAALDHEELAVCYLTAKNTVIRVETAATGGPVSVVVTPHHVFGPAYRLGASALILAHPHPSGDPSPSLDDERLTDRLAVAGSHLGIRILDHIVIGGQGSYYSFADHGRMGGVASSHLSDGPPRP